jgi:hypothetical protein
MPPREDRPTLDTLRDAARERVAAIGLRQVAREIGTTHVALRRFVHGGLPHSTTRAKLWTWFEGDEVLSLRREVAELRKQVAELERQLRERKR